MTKSGEKNGASPTNSVGKVFEVMAWNRRRCLVCGRTFAPEEAAAHAKLSAIRERKKVLQIGKPVRTIVAEEQESD